MKIERETLLAALKLVKPAISDIKNQVEELSHIWFDGEYLSAFDDLIGIKIAFKSDFVGGVQGEKILGVLDASRSADVLLEKATDGNLQMKLGAARVKLALRPIEDWFWDPKLPEAFDPFTITNDFLKGIGLTLLSVGSGKVLNPEQRGITLITGQSFVGMYSTDAATISHINIPVDDSPFDSDKAILPTAFCQQLLTMPAGAKLYFDENSVFCTSDIKINGSLDSDVLVFSRLVSDTEGTVPDFEKTVAGLINTNGCFNVHEGLRLSIERAQVLLSDGQPLEFEYNDGQLFVFAETAHGEIDDVLKVEGDGQPNITTKFDAKLLRRGLEGRETMSMSRRACVMTGPKGFYYIVASK